MDRRLTVIILVIAVVATTGATLSTATSSQTQPEDDDSSMGTAVSSFMQVSVVEADSTVDRKMWEVAFENADNESERAALLEQRSNRLSRELSSIRTERKQLGGGENSTTQARNAALGARLTELRESINNASRTANKSNVRSPKLSTLRKEACTVTVSNTSTIVDVSSDNGSELNCPPGWSSGNRSNGTDGNNTTETPPGNGTDGNNTTETPPGNGTGGNNTTETPPGNGTGGNNTTETVTGTETPQNPDNQTGTPTEDPTGTGTPQNPDTPSNSTDTPTAAPTATENNTSSIDTPIEVTDTTEKSGISLLDIDSRYSRVTNQRPGLH